MARSKYQRRAAPLLPYQDWFEGLTEEQQQKVLDFYASFSCEELARIKNSSADYRRIIKNFRTSVNSSYIDWYFVARFATKLKSEAESKYSDPTLLDKEITNHAEKFGLIFDTAVLASKILGNTKQKLNDPQVVGSIKDSSIKKYLLMVVATIATGGLAYPLKKLYNSLANRYHSATSLFTGDKNKSGHKVVRSIYRIAGIGIGGYVGTVYGALAGAAIGSIVPVIGTGIGAVLGAIIGSGACATIGALLTKYTAKFISYLLHGDTNPDKWTLTTQQQDALIKKDGVKNSDSSISRMLDLQIMDIIDTAKRNIGSTFPGTQSHGKKADLNKLLENVKKRQFKIIKPEQTADVASKEIEITVKKMVMFNEKDEETLQLLLNTDIFLEMNNFRATKLNNK